MDVNVSPDKPASPSDQSPTGVNKLTFHFFSKNPFLIYALTKFWLYILQAAESRVVKKHYFVVREVRVQKSDVIVTRSGNM